LKFKTLIAVLFLTVPAFCAEEEYKISSDDVLEIFVWQNADLCRSVVVQTNGKISLPLIKDIQAEGLTSQQLTQDITNRLIPFIKQPQVSVIISKFSHREVTILGQVKMPGSYPVRKNFKLVELISLSQGFTETAATDDVRIVRNGTERQTIEVDVDEILEGKTDDVVLEPGDVVFVPQTTWSETTTFLDKIATTLTLVVSIITLTVLLIHK